MDLTYPTSVEANGSSTVSEENLAPPTYVSMVDPFLVEALQNPRHRLTVLRMELDIQNFLQNTILQQFEFPHFPTSYLRLAAHRVAQHYGMQTMVQDNTVDGQGIKILVIKKPESKFPAVCLLDVPAKEPENQKLGQVKVVIRPRPKASTSDLHEMGLKRNPVRSMEEREEEYERARARIFSSPSNSESEDAPAAFDGTDIIYGNDNEVSRNIGMEGDKRQCNSGEVGYASRMATFRDREKDRYDPDYDRSYDRYMKSIRLAPSSNMQQHFQSPFVQYGQMPVPHNYQTAVMSPYCAISHNSGDAALYMPWPTHSMMYAQSYDQLRHAFFLASSSQQQPLSFDYSQNYR